jgi:hypothetical protein
MYDDFGLEKTERAQIINKFVGFCRRLQKLTVNGAAYLESCDLTKEPITILQILQFGRNSKFKEGFSTAYQSWLPTCNSRHCQHIVIAHPMK